MAVGTFLIATPRGDALGSLVVVLRRKLMLDDKELSSRRCMVGKWSNQPWGFEM